MKKILSVLFAVSLISCVSCGSSSGGGSQGWEFTDMDMDSDNWVSNSDCEDILSESQCRQITKELRSRYENNSISASSSSVSGLLSKTISLEEEGDGDYYYLDYTSEFDDLFSVSGHSLNVVASVGYYNEKDGDFIEFELYAFYDASKSDIEAWEEEERDDIKYAFCELDFISK